MSGVPRPEYPRPQFRRPDWVNLNGEWAFAFDDEREGMAGGWQHVSAEQLRNNQSTFDRTIIVPFGYQTRLSGIGDRTFHDVVWYARVFDPPSLDEDGGRLLLHFGALDYCATVWVNGTQVTSHEGGHTPFSADVTDALRKQENVIVVRALEGKRSRRTASQIARLALSYAALIFLTLIFVAPLLWMLSTSFKNNVEATTLPLTFLPQEPSTYGYDTIRNSAGTPVLRWFINSMVAASLHTALVLVTAAPAAYALARMEFRGKRIFFATIIGTLFIPQFLFLVPNYAIVDAFGWLDTLLAIIIPGAAGAFGVFFLRRFFLGLPREIEEAALLDGANRLQIFARIVLPLSKPPLATLALLSFLTNYNDFLWPIYVLFNPESLTLPPGLAILGFSYQTDYAVIMAGGVIASIPVLIIFVIAQRYVIEVIARSGIKG